MSVRLIPSAPQISSRRNERMRGSRSLVVGFLIAFLNAIPNSTASAQQDRPKGNAKPAAQPSVPNNAAIRPRPFRSDEQSQFITIKGAVLKEDGEPARLSQVWLYHRKHSRNGLTSAALVESIRADGEGQFQFRYPYSLSHPQFDAVGRRIENQLHVIAMTRDHVLTTTFESWSNANADRNGFDGIKLRALPMREFSGRLLDSEGQPISNASVSPERLFYTVAENNLLRSIDWFPELAARYATVTDAEGKFKLTGIPHGPQISARVVAPELGTRIMNWPSNTEPDLVFEQSGTIRGKLTNIPDGTFCSQISLELINIRLPGLGLAIPRVLSLYQTEIDADGAFEITDIAPGKYRLTITRVNTIANANQFPTVDCEVKSDETTDNIELQLPKLIVVHGSVVDDSTGIGIANATIQVLGRNERQRQLICTEITNEDGEYRAYVPPGAIAVNLIALPIGYLQSPREFWRHEETHEEDFEAPTIRLKRTIDAVKGIVVDQDNLPVPGAKVWSIRAGNSQLIRGPQPIGVVTTDALGGFEILNVDPHQVLSLRVSSDDAVSVNIAIQPEAFENVQRIEIARKNVFRFKGVLVDDQGRPIPRGQIRVTWYRSISVSRQYQRASEASLEFSVSDELGQFESPALWPEDRYLARIEVDGFRKVELPLILGIAGKSHDYGKIELTSINYAVIGRVIDRQGRPVPNVTVSNNSDGPAPVTAETDANGEFKLRGLPAGPMYVFIDNPKYHFAGAYTPGKSAPAIVTLIPRTEPLPSRPVVDVATIDTQRQRTVDKLLQWINDANLSIRPDLQRSGFAAMAKTDPQGVPLEIAKLSPVRELQTATMLAKHLAPARPHKDDLNIQEKKSRETATMFLDRAASRLEDLDAKSRVYWTADVGLLFLRLGNRERGTPLVNEAARAWVDDPAPAVSMHANDVERIAQGLAWIEVARALGLIETVRDQDRKISIRNRVILEVARFDPVRALEIFRDPTYVPQRGYSDDSLKRDLAYRLGKTQPQQAADLLSSIGPMRMKAEAAGWIAVAVGEENPELARSLIDEAFQLLKHGRRSSLNTFYHEYVPGLAAQLAYQAAQINDPRLESLIQKSLALRIPPTPTNSAIGRLQSSVNAATYLAFVDPAIAKRLLTDLEPDIKTRRMGNGGYDSISQRGWLYAWILADPEHAAELLRVELDKHKSTNAKSGIPESIQDALTLLCLPRAEQLDYVQRHPTAGLVRPYED